MHGNQLVTSPWLQMTNVLGLGGSNVNFALRSSTSGGYGVAVPTDLGNW